MTGLYPAPFAFERFLASVSAQTLGQVLICPCDLEIVGLALNLGTAAGGTNGVTVNISDLPTSQNGSGQGYTQVNAYNLWTSTNVPTVAGTATSNMPSTTSDVFYGTQNRVLNRPYQLKYPLPGPSGTTGFITAQSTALGTSTPVTSPPVMYLPSVTALVAPDNTYTDLNGITAVPASRVHAGDILSFVIAAVSGGTVGSAANLEIVLYAQAA